MYNANSFGSVLLSEIDSTRFVSIYFGLIRITLHDLFLYLNRRHASSKDSLCRAYSLPPICVYSVVIEPIHTIVLFKISVLGRWENRTHVLALRERCNTTIIMSGI
jgi:hypothetical protein